MSVMRIYVEKKPQFAVEAGGVLSDLITALRPEGLMSLRIVNRYDVEGIDEDVFTAVTPTIFSEPQVDLTYSELPALADDEMIFASEFLPGQFDQRADSCEQCIQIATQGIRPKVATAKLYILKGTISDQTLERIKSYLINPVESREASLTNPDTLKTNYPIPTTVKTLTGFTALDADGLAQFIKEYGLAMDQDDITFCQAYFKDTEQRDPTITEIRMIDTYWSDHCRHTTFSTNIDNISIPADYIKAAYNKYITVREALYTKKNKPLTLMDLATIAGKKLKADGILKILDESEEVNACSIKIKVDTDNGQEDYLLMFKNETHNHPTEIEPFGGAATCLGGAIRDPLSGRSYVYQAMRVTGASNPLVPTEDTLKGKLPQRKICVGAASGYSSYGNQIGLATGLVDEIYHPGYVAKRMEIGAVIAAAPAKNVVRLTPLPSDVIILLGGKTGRDGCGGATGSSKSHTLESLESCGAEVQKGNPPEERKIQRLFRNPAVTSLIKRCNDFGAGGVSVAIGELADGLIIDLNHVPKKYEGLDGTELAISESQERMAVVVDKKDADRFIALAKEENLLATAVATVTDDNRLKMVWNDNIIVDLSREFLNSNGAVKHTDIEVCAPDISLSDITSVPYSDFTTLLSDINFCSKKGLVERFDASIGAGTVLMPFGGKKQLSPTQAMVAKIPVMEGQTNTCSVMAYGYNPLIAEKSPFHSAQLAVIDSIAKLVAAGGNFENTYLTFQEYFERTQNNPARWGKPFAALLGAFDAQLGLQKAAIGGKDSMSGTFEEIDVPPTLVSFAVSTAKADCVISPEFKNAGSYVYLLVPKYNADGTPDYASICSVFNRIEALISSKKLLSCWALQSGGIAEGIAKMCFGNHIGFTFEDNVAKNTIFSTVYGGFLFETAERCDESDAVLMGKTTEKYTITYCNELLSLDELEAAWKAPLEPVYPVNTKLPKGELSVLNYNTVTRVSPRSPVARPRVLIPVFPGTNCEYDTAKAFESAGAEPTVFVIRNLSGDDIEQSVAQMASLIRQSQIIMLPGGFSGGDEPDGSGKFITAFFRNPRIKEAVSDLLDHRDGLMLGICNGFQALIKLGLVPFGKIIEMDEQCPTLTYNKIGRHQSMMVHTRIASNKSPWLAGCQTGDIHTVPISHGEGRFVADSELIAALAANGQIATQYVDLSGEPSLSVAYNPNASNYAIEGITSPDGRILGKMAHSERIGSHLYKNVNGNHDQKIFQSGVSYFK